MKRLVFTLLFGISVLAAAAQEFGQVCTEKVPDEIHHFDRYKVNSQFYDADLIEQKNDRGVQRWSPTSSIMGRLYSTVSICVIAFISSKTESGTIPSGITGPMTVVW